MECSGTTSRTSVTATSGDDNDEVDPANKTLGLNKGTQTHSFKYDHKRLVWKDAHSINTEVSETVGMEVRIPEHKNTALLDTEETKKLLDSGVGHGSGTGDACPVKRKSASEDSEQIVSREIKKAKLETKALKARRPGFSDERYNETSYYLENGLRKVHPYYFTFTTFTKGRWVGEKILDVFAREFRAHPVQEYERCIKAGTLTVNYTKVDTDYRLKHNDLLANIVHRHEVPITSVPIEVIHQDEDLVVVNKPASIPVHPCGRYRHNTVVFILAKEHQLKNLRTIHRLDRLTSGLLLFGKHPTKAREMEHQIRNRLVQKEYVCRVEGDFPEGEIECVEPIEVVSYKIGVCKVSKDGKDCRTVFKKLSFNGKTSVVIARPRTGRMHQIRVHLQFLGYPIVNDPLYNHPVFGPEKGKGGITGKTDDALIAELISIHNAENWLGIDGEEGSGTSGADIFGPPLSLTSTVDGVGIINVTRYNSLPLVEDGTAQSAKEETKSLNRDISSDVVSIKCNKKLTSSNGDSIETGTETLSTISDEQTQTATARMTVGTQTILEQDALSPSQSTKTHLEDKSVLVSCPNPNPTAQDLVVTASHSCPEPTLKHDLLTVDPHCYECKVKYRDPKPKDLIMYLHALSYRGPGWCYETKHPDWAEPSWREINQDQLPTI